MPFCPECECEYEDDTSSCPDCGTSLVATLEEQEEYICDECKEPLTEDARWCRQCGTIFVATLRCFHHPELSAYGKCVVCGQHVCLDCAVQHMGRYFCEQDAMIEEVEGEVTDTDTVTGLDWGAEPFKRALEQRDVACRLFSQNDMRRVVSRVNVNEIQLVAPLTHRNLVGRIFTERNLMDEVVLYECERCSAICIKEETFCPNCGE